MRADQTSKRNDTVGQEHSVDEYTYRGCRPRESATRHQGSESVSRDKPSKRKHRGAGHTITGIHGVNTAAEKTHYRAAGEEPLRQIVALGQKRQPRGGL